MKIIGFLILLFSLTACYDVWPEKKDTEEKEPPYEVNYQILSPANNSSITSDTFSLSYKAYNCKKAEVDINYGAVNIAQVHDTPATIWTNYIINDIDVSALSGNLTLRMFCWTDVGGSYQSTTIYLYLNKP